MFSQVLRSDIIRYSVFVVGVSFDDDVDMEVELSMSVEEQLQCSLDSLCDDVIKRHTATQPPSAADSCMYFTYLLKSLLLVIRSLKDAICSSCEQVYRY